MAAGQAYVEQLGTRPGAGGLSGARWRRVLPPLGPPRRCVRGALRPAHTADRGLGNSKGEERMPQRRIPARPEDAAAARRPGGSPSRTLSLPPRDTGGQADPGAR
jgi:hypothetical protein